MFFIDLISLFVFVEMQDKITGTTSESTSTSFTLPQTSIRLITERDQTPTKLASDNVIRIDFGVTLLIAIYLLLFHVYNKFRVKKNHIKMTEMYIHDENQTVESVYHDIGDGVGMKPQHTLTTLSIVAERPKLPPRELPAKRSNTRSTLTIEYTNFNP